MDNQLIALNPHEMSLAQTSLIEWCTAKLLDVQGEAQQLHNLIESLRKANMSDATPRRLVTKLRKRLDFYTKIKAALEAGYYILPPIPHQTFAIRSNKELPPPKESHGPSWKGDEPTPQALPAGEGEYHNATAEREITDVVTVTERDKEVEKNVWRNTAWKDIEFPFFPVKPEIVEATGKALSAKIFDWMGVAPQYRAADPMVIGCIKHYKQYQQPLHFFVAWWLDTNTL